MKIDGLNIDFPDLYCFSDRQGWYANYLRESYVKAHFDRFLEIEERSEREADERIRADSGNYEEQYKDYTFCMPLTDAEKICLFCEDAGGLIGFMKGYRESHEEEFEY